MSAKEIDRLHWMRLLAERCATQRSAAEALVLTTRHLRRLYAVFQVAGAAALTSKRRGSRCNRAAPDADRVQVVGLVRTLYGDFGPTLACEKLAVARGNQRNTAPSHLTPRTAASSAFTSLFHRLHWAGEPDLKT